MEFTVRRKNCKYAGQGEGHGKRMSFTFDSKSQNARALLPGLPEGGHGVQEE